MGVGGWARSALTGSLKAPWTQARYFSIVDDDGPLFLAQWSSCGDDLSATKSECELFGTASELAPEWSEPLPEPRLGEVGCGTREWEFVNPPAIGTFDMYRLAVRFDTDDGVVDVLDRHAASVNLGTQSYEIFATDVVGEVDDPSVIYGGTGYHQYAAFFMVRTP